MNLTCLFLFKESPKKTSGLVATESQTGKGTTWMCLEPIWLVLSGATPFHLMGLKFFQHMGHLASVQTYQHLPAGKEGELAVMESCGTPFFGKSGQISKAISSMYGIFTYIWWYFMVNVGKYTIHGWYGKATANNQQSVWLNWSKIRERFLVAGGGHQMCAWKLLNKDLRRWPSRMLNLFQFLVRTEIIWITRWWLQPLWKICLLNWIISLGIEVKINKNHWKPLPIDISSTHKIPSTFWSKKSLKSGQLG